MNFLKDENGFGNIVYAAVGLTIFLILISSIVMPTILSTNTGDTMNCLHSGLPVAYNASCGNAWSVASVAMWGILPIVVIAGAIMFTIGKQ